MLIGFVLLLASSTVEPMPVSELIYTDKAVSEQVKKRLLDRRQNASLECAPVKRKLKQFENMPIKLIK